MIKLIALLTRKPGMSREAFIAYYETTHAPLILRLTPMIQAYSRNFIDWDGGFPAGNGGKTDFDCITEIRFASSADHAAALALWSRPDIAAAVAADEENVFDRSRTRMFTVEERRSIVP